MRIECLCGTNQHRFYLFTPCFKPKHAYAVKPEVLISWTLEMDYSRAPCLGADQKTRGLWERDCSCSLSSGLAPCSRISEKSSSRREILSTEQPSVVDGNFLPSSIQLQYNAKQCSVAKHRGRSRLKNKNVQNMKILIIYTAIFNNIYNPTVIKNVILDD